MKKGCHQYFFSISNGRSYFEPLVKRAQEQFEEQQARKILKKIAKINLALMVFNPNSANKNKMEGVKDFMRMIPGAGAS